MEESRLQNLHEKLIEYSTSNNRRSTDQRSVYNYLLNEFEDIIQSYQQLKSDHEEEKELREKYKKSARASVCFLSIDLEKESKLTTSRRVILVS